LNRRAHEETSFLVLFVLEHPPEFIPRLFVATLFWSGFQVSAMVTNLQLVNILHESAVPHVEQSDLLVLVVAGQSKNAFEEAFELETNSSQPCSALLMVWAPMWGRVSSSHGFHEPT
jgi:hypothetical protein